MTRKIFTSLLLCLTVVMAWADEPSRKPFIESLTGSISGNTLTLTATMNYDKIENQIRETVKYHWTKGGVEQTGANNSLYTENNALTTEDIQWEVYATYTYNGQNYTTNTMYYTQTPPVVKLTGAVSGDNLNLTASCNDYNGQLTDIQYHWLTYTYDENDKRTAHEDADNHTATKTVPALRFEEEVWHVYATYTYNAQQYQTEPDRYLQVATPLPTLTVSKVEDHEQGHDQLVMNASLSPDYSSKLTELKYHWSNNAVEQTDHNDAHREVPHAFDTQLWRCWATFTYDGKEYKTNDDTYTYYSTLGRLNFHADKQSDGTILATLQEAGSLGSDINVAYTWKDSKNGSGNGTSYTRQNDAEWVEFTATITQNGTSNKLVKYAFYSFDGAHTVVYIKYTGGGNDNNDGRTPETPVATWKKAYSLLNNGGWDQNIIVIVNGTGTGNMIINNEDTDGKAATITGQWPLDKAMDHNTAGIIYVSGSTTNDKTGARIGAPTRFRNVVFYSAQGKTSRFSCHLNDVEFAEGVVMKNFPNLATNSGATSGRTAPDFHLQLYADQYANDVFPQDKNKVMQVTIKSGQFGRILASRIAGTKAKNTYIIGRHDNPLKANITVDIQDVAGNRNAGGKSYTDDIAYIAAGLTQGMMWGDITMNIKRGSIATLVAGSQGNALNMGSLKVPVSTYCGRTVVNVMAENNNDVVIQNYYGACQGRVYNDNDPLICDAYFYGKSTLNMTGGTIQADIFASSAGISGLRSSDPDYFAKKWYTSDQRIPYPGSFAYGIDYLPFDRNKQIVTMTTHNGTIDLNDTEIQMNISGGVVNNVYGGSYGYSDVLPAKVAPAHAGRLFGNTSVNISGGTVNGNVYAGGKGATEYYTTAANDKKVNFSDVAQVYGNTNVTITGTPNFHGNIYGGGAGVDATVGNEFLEIARVYGSTNVVFDADYTDKNPFKGNIYGGGAHGGVEGSTNVIIRKGVIVGNVFGGGQGQEGYPNKAKVVGTTEMLAAAPTDNSEVKIYGNVYGGGEKAQVIEPNLESVRNHVIQDADLATLFTKEHTYTTYVRLGENTEVYGRTFGGGMGHEDSKGESAGRVTGQTDVVLDGATVWSEIFGGGENADVRGNTLVHFKKGKAGHNAFGGGLGKLTETKDNGVVLPDNRQTPLASADIKLIPANYNLIVEDTPTNLATLKGYYNIDGTTDPTNVNWWQEKKTGESFVVFDGTDDSYTQYEFEKARTFAVVDGKPVVAETDQYNPANPSQLFSINHNIYGGGMTASKIEGKTFVYINHGMVNEDMMNYTVGGEKVWSNVYNSIANAQFCVFGGGYGFHSQVNGDTNVTMDILGSGQYKYINAFTDWFAGTGKTKYHWDTNVGDPEAIYNAADESTWSHGAPGRSCMDVIGGGYNGKVLGTTNITIGGDVIVRKVYGGGYYASVGNTNVNILSGIFNRVYGGGLIGNVYGKATLNIGQVGTTDDIIKYNTHLMVKDAIYGGNDVSGTVGTSTPVNVTRNGVTYNVYSPVDDDNHGVRMNIYGGLVLGDVYGAGNGNHPGYGNPDYMEFNLSQHPSENYRTLAHAGTKGTTHVYKYRPRTGRVVMNIQGNSGTDFNDAPLVDKVRIWGRTFGGGNSCNVGIWNGEQDDNTEEYTPTGWHPGDNFTGQGTITLNIGSHVQLGNRNDSHETPNGLFMGCNGEHMITQHLDKEKAKYYHQYWDSKAQKYYPGFVVYEDDAKTPIKRTTGLKAFKAFINNILTKSDNVTLNIKNLDGKTEAQDVWMSNFVGGGYRGSMQAYSETGRFNYTLPEGVTIGHSVVGGAFNAHIIYRVYATEYGDGTYKTDTDGNYIYETVEPKGDGSVISKAEAEEQGLADYDYIKKLYAEGHEGEEEYKTGYLRYNFDGGMLAHDSQMNATNTGSRIHKVHNPTDYANADFTADAGYIANKDKSLVHLELRNRLHPMVHEADQDAGTELNVHGGIVYGGCFLTGYVEGDSWVDYDCSLSPLCTDSRFFSKENTKIYDEVADLTRNNALNVFGAGYGADTHSMGDVYLCIKSIGTNTGAQNGNYPFIYNAFGGGNMGTVAGSTSVYYDGGKQGTMLGSLYGGGYKGDIDGNTFVELVQGFLVNVYGGSRQANIKGAAHVWAYDGSTRATTGLTPETYNHLIVCNMYGGNDISGTISGTMPAIWSKSAWSALEGKEFNSYIQVSGTNPGTKGFPLVGNVYGGGNGEGWSAELGAAPNVEKSFLEIDGGTTLSAFGGGNKATITDDAWILVNATGNNFADVTFTDYQKAILEDKFFKGVLTGYNWNGDELIMSQHHVDNIFGGNNVATMAIQPKWNLKSGYVGNVYSGGNMGDMTYYNPSPATGETKGLSITIDSDDINIESLYGGCRMSDVKATLYTKDSEGNVTDEAPQTFGTDEYGATVNVEKGHIGNVYGGNDISGYVYNGTNVNLYGSITGNVYGAGNGNYLYAYDKTSTHDIVGTKSIAEVWNDDVNQYVYWIPGAAGDSNLKQLVSLTNIRPHVSKAYLNIEGKDENNKVYIFGSVYCGGNASTIRSRDNGNADAHVKFNIGDNVIVNEVFMGSNGASMKYDANDKNNTYLTDFEKVNNLDLSADMTEADWTELLTMYGLSNDKKELIKTIYPNLLSVYMSAVDMKAMPQGFTEFSGHEFKNTWIGTFCMGGNAGSMMTDQPVDIVFPQSLNFFGRIIGGSKDASFQYKGKWHRGGFRMPVASTATLDGQPTKTKLRMKIRGNWYSRRMNMDAKYKNVVANESPDGDYLVYDKTDDGVNWKIDGKAWHDGCNVYGGCYQSGDMVGDVEIYIESDMLAYSDPRYQTTIDEYQNQELVESNKLNIPVANVYGAGYGPESRSFGDAYIYMKDIPNVAAHHPSVNNLFGGGRNGMLVGNSVIHVHDGLVFKDVVGGSFAAPMYGSAQVTVGYPKFYVCKQTGEYFLDRADKWNGEYQTKGYKDNEPVVKKSIKYFKGTYVPCNVYEQITGVKPYNNNTPGDLVSLNADNKSSYFDFHDEGADASFFPEGGWSNVEIRVRGGVYGGGFSLSNSTSAIAGTYTTLASTDEFNHGVDSQGNSSVGFGGNSSIIITDQGTTKDHIKISTENAVVNGVYSGTGGVYGDGRLVFCEGFRTAELNGYGYAQHTPSNPLMLNSLQRLDLLTVNDCCFKLYGDQDFATDELNSQQYSLARIGELRMNSTIDATKPYATGDLTTAQSRNYIGFFNNIHYLGSIVTNDDFHEGKLHSANGALDNTHTYYAKKLEYISNYNNSDKGPDATNVFKLRNYATARNMVGINSGYCLRVENQYYNNNERDTYYGPIVGVAEVKLLNVQPGEGGGYVYADNIHADIFEPGHSTSEATFMNESGNFVFEGVHRPGDADGEKQFIVDDCLPTGFDEWKTGRAVASELPEQHYWYVIGDTYYYNSTLTAFSYKDAKTFDLTKSDPNVIFAGIEDGSEVSLQSVQWQTATYPGGYSGDIRGGRDGSLTPLAGSDKKYEFTLQVGNLINESKAWSALMPRSTTTDEQISSQTWTAYNSENTTPRFNVHLIDNVNNCPVGSEETYFNDHLSVPERVKLIIKARKQNGTTAGGIPTYETKTYNMNLEIVYLQGPSFTGNVNITNCALPGEHIGFNSKDIQIKTTQQLPVTNYGWKLVPVVNDDAPYRWQDAKDGIDIPASYYRTSAEGYLEGSIPALYSQNHWNILYTFNAGGETFTVTPTTDEEKALSERMLVVHNYHKMADITDDNYDVTLGDGEGNLFSKALKTGARIYIADADDLTAFMNYVNGGNTGEGLNFYLQDNLALPSVWSITEQFKGTFHGDGYVLNASAVTGTKTIFGDKLTGTVYNLGVTNGNIASTGTVTNCFDNTTNANDVKYGKSAYNLSHYFTAANDASERGNYVHNYYAGEDWHYARIYDRNDSHVYLRTKAPNYGNTQTSHNTEHTGEYTPVEHDYLFFGQALNPTTGDAHPVHIATNEENRVYKAEGYYNSKVDEGFYFNKAAAWAMQPGLTAVRFDNAAGNVPTSMGAVEGVTRNLLVFEADAATQASGSKAFFHVKGSKGNNAYNNTQNVYTLTSMPLVDKQDFNAPYAFTAQTASYEREPAHFVETRGTAWESLCLPFAPATVKADDNDITHFYGAPFTDHIDGTEGDKNANSIGHEYWLRELTGSKTENEKDYVKFSRPASAAYVAYRPYIVSFPGTPFYEFNLTGSTIRWEKSNAVITVTDDATKSMTAGGYTYTGAFKNEAQTDGKFVVNDEGSAFTSGAVVPFRGWLSAASASAKGSRAILIGSDYDDVIVQEEPEAPFAPDGSDSNVFLIRINGLQVTIVSSESLECPCHTVSGASLGVWMIPAGESRFTVPSPGIYILNGRKFVVK